MIIDLEYHDKENRRCKMYDFQLGDKHCDIDNPVLINFSIQSVGSLRCDVFIPLCISPELKDGGYYNIDYIDQHDNKYWDNISLIKDIVLVNGFNLPNMDADRYYFSIQKMCLSEGNTYTQCRFILYSDNDHITEIWNEKLSPYYLFVRWGHK